MAIQTRRVRPDEPCPTCMADHCHAVPSHFIQVPLDLFTVDSSPSAPLADTVCRGCLHEGHAHDLRTTCVTCGH